MKNTCIKTWPSKIAMISRLDSCIAAILLLLMVSSSYAQYANLDCNHPDGPMDRASCFSLGHWTLDELMDMVYKKAAKKATDPSALEKKQQQWREDLTKYCKTERCMEGAYFGRMRALDKGDGAKVYDTPELKARREADKAVKVRDILKQHPMQLRDSATYTETEQSVCGQVYEALSTASQEVEYIEPILRTDDPFHPSLGEYLYCDDYEPVRADKYFSLHGELGTRGFRLYRLDMDGNPQNGMEEYLYAQEPDSSTFGGSAGLSRLVRDADWVSDYGECGLTDGTSATPEGRDLQHHISNGINALIRYQGRYYFYDLKHLGGDYYHLDTLAYNQRERMFLREYCFFNVPHDN